MERVHDVAAVVAVDRAGRGDEGLAGHLAAEDPLALLVRELAPEDVDLDRLEVEQRRRGRRRRPAASRSAITGSRSAGTVPPMPTTSFPDGFRWGTATAAHQIEGGNWNNDWWEWEHTPGSGCIEPSGDALRH